METLPLGLCRSQEERFCTPEAFTRMFPSLGLPRECRMLALHYPKMQILDLRELLGKCGYHHRDDGWMDSSTTSQSTDLYLLLDLRIRSPVLLLQVSVVIIWKWGWCWVAARFPHFPQVYSSYSQESKRTSNIDAYFPSRWILYDCKKTVI